MGCSCEAQSDASDNSRPKPTRVPLAPVAVDSSYSFVRYDLNRLELGSDSTRMQHFAEKWFRVTSTRKGKINIMHLGSSHVQGGTFPHRVRRNVLLPYTDFVADRGMLFPYSAAAKCNNPFDYKVMRSRVLDLTRNVYKEPAERLGLCGIAVTAADSAADIAIQLAEPDIMWGTNRIVLFGESRGGVVPCLAVTEKVDKSGLMQWKEMSPDEIDTSLRRYEFRLEEAVDSFHVVLPCGEGQSFALTGVYLANDEPGISYHSIGVNGASLNDYLSKCPYFTHDLRMIKPDLVIFGIGINDASGNNFDTVVFKQKYLQLVDSIRSVNPDCAFIFITNNDSYRHARRKYTVNENGALARDVFYRLAEETGGAVWDQFAIMGGLRSMQTWYDHNLAQKDRVHFTRAGYELLGDLLSNALFETLKNMKPTTPAPATAAPVQTERREPPQQTTNPKALYKKKNTRGDNGIPERIPYL